MKKKETFLYRILFVYMHLQRKRKRSITNCEKCSISTGSTWKTFCTSCWLDYKTTICETPTCLRHTIYKHCSTCFKKEIQLKKEKKENLLRELNLTCPSLCGVNPGRYSLKGLFYSISSVSRQVPLHLTCLKCKGGMMKPFKFKYSCDSCNYFFYNCLKLTELHPYGGIKRRFKDPEARALLRSAKLREMKAAPHCDHS